MVFHFPDRDKPAADDEGGGNDSIWAVVAGTVKAYNLPIDYVLYDMSYVNMIMYGAVLPSYRSRKEGEKGGNTGQDIIRADDPANRDRVRRFLDSIE